jgi:putative ABC transport system permease protein
VPDRDDPLVGSFGFPEPVVVEIVGLFEVTNPDGDFWIGDRGLHQPTLVPVGINIVMVYATALASPDAYPAMGDLRFPMRYAFRYYTDPERLHAGMLEDLVTELRQMESRYASFASQPDETRTTLQTGLLEVTRGYLDERRSSEAVLVTAAIGPAAVAFAAIGVLALLAVQRRRSSLVLLRSRGGSAPQLVGSHLVEGLLLTVAPAAAAVLLANWLVPARPTPAAPFAAGLVAVGTILVMAAVTLPIAFRSLRTLDREQPASLASSPRRLAFEGLAVGLAIGGVVLLRQRGLAGGSAAGELEGVDPFLAAVPALVGIAVGLVTVRLYPYPVRLAGWLAAAGRGLVPALGLRRAERQGGAGFLPLVVLLLTVAIGTFASTMLATLDRGQVQQAWRAVGAAHHVSGTDQLLDDVDLGDVPGVEAAAGAHVGDASVGIGGGGRAVLFAIDAAL